MGTRHIVEVIKDNKTVIRQYRILDVIGIFSCFDEIKNDNLKIPIFLESEDVDTGRKIIINLDKETFTCRYFDKEQTWNFDKLPTLTELRKVDKW